MSFRTVVVAVLALVCGVSAAIAVGQFRKKDQVGPAEKETVEIVVAAIEIDRGTTIAPDMVVMCPWPKAHVSVSAITSFDDAVGRTALTALYKDEPLLKGKIAEGRGLAPLIPDGMRATSIQITESSAVAGFILPGNRVDVLLSMDERGSAQEEATTQTLLQMVEVLAVGQLLEAPSENNFDTKSTRSVTLLVTPQQSAKLELARNQGTLSLTLRSDSDEMAADTRPITKRELRGLEERPIDMSKFRDFTEGLKDLGAKIAESMRSQKKSSPEAKPAVKEYRIRTVRGNIEGGIKVLRVSGEQRSSTAL